MRDNFRFVLHALARFVVSAVVRARRTRVARALDKRKNDVDDGVSFRAFSCERTSANYERERARYPRRALCMSENRVSIARRAWTDILIHARPLAQVTRQHEARGIDLVRRE